MPNTREKVIELLLDMPFGNSTEEAEERHASDTADYLIDNGVTVQKQGRWIQRNKGQNNWVECSECNTVGSPFWKCCPVCEAKMPQPPKGD